MSTVTVSSDVANVTDIVTVVTNVGDGSVVVDAVTSMQEHALEYLAKLEQADAYCGYVDAETVICRLLSTVSVVIGKVVRVIVF